MIDFSNTQVAFQGKSHNELRRAYRLFRLVSSSFIVKTGNYLLNFAVKIHFPVGWLVKPFYQHFCGGENIAQSAKTIEYLAKFNVKVILDYSVEGKETTHDYEAALAETLRTIENAIHIDNIAFCVFKPTAFTSEILLERISNNSVLDSNEIKEKASFEKRIGKICRAAFESKIPVLIDAEESWFQKPIDKLADEMMVKYNRNEPIVYNTFQMYRTDRLNFLKVSHDKAQKNNYFLGAKFVRGAYLEKERLRALEMGYPSPVFPDKASTDKEYNQALEFSIQHINKIFIFNGTHNEESCQYLVDLMQKFNIPKDDKRIYFSQLYGMSDHISFNLAHEGYNVAKYLPYGPVNQVLPYLIRRAEENTSIKGQSGRELRLIVQERKRRKFAK